MKMFLITIGRPCDNRYTSMNGKTESYSMIVNLSRLGKSGTGCGNTRLNF